MIYYCTPFSLEKNLGKSYNEYVRKLTSKKDDWVFFIDGDAMFLDPNWGNHVNDLVNKYPNTGIFTCYTNRVGNKHQCLGYSRSENPNVLDHFKISSECKEDYWKVKNIDRVISGVFFGFSREIWDLVGGFTENQEILKVDNRFSKKVLDSGRKILLMEGVYIFHYYRMHSLDPKKDKKHLL